MTGDNAARRAEDIGGQELSYAEVKAIASGNPAVLTLAEADAELQRLAILKKNHADEQFLARRARIELPETIARLEQRIEDLSADLATATAQQARPAHRRRDGPRQRRCPGRSRPQARRPAGESPPAHRHTGRTV